MQGLIHKNRNREDFSFANINLLGKSNANCFFCLGKDIASELEGKNQLKIHFNAWKNFRAFLNRCENENIKKLYLTGQTADGLQYQYLSEIVNYLKDRGFEIGVRTNGYLAKEKLDIIKQMNGEIGYSIHTLLPDINKQIMGRRDLPDWGYLIPNSGDNVRISIVVNRYNVGEVESLIHYLSQFDNVKYIQLRRISTDTRYDFHEEDLIVYEKFFKEFSAKYPQKTTFFGAEVFEVYGKEINFWRTVETSCNSINYFTDGTVSDEYFVVEGYLKNREGVVTC